MVSPRLYKSSHAYDFFFRSLGFENGIARFLRDLQMEVPAGSRILDAGCGTGLLGLHFVERIPDATLLSTDLQPNFLKATLAKAARRQIDPNRIQVGVADISTPSQVTLPAGIHQAESTDDAEPSPATSSMVFNLANTIDDGTFGLICVGAVVGYAKDTETSLRQLLRLLSPGGVLLNLEMSQSLTRRLVSRRYHYRNLSHARLCEVMEDAGCRVTVQNLRISHLPAKLTRTAIIVRKPCPD